MKLYSYWRSTTAYRVRAALNLKGLSYEIETVNLLEKEQKSPDYLALNPSGAVPTLRLDDGTLLTQSLAIMDYLDSLAPEPLLIPQDPRARAKVLAAAYTIALDVHPLNNLRVIERLKGEFAAEPNAVRRWMLHWMVEGCTALEVQLSGAHRFCFGSLPDLSDLCLVAQLYNARRWGLDTSAYPKLRRVEAACLEHPAIAAAHPGRQPDAKGGA